MKMTIVGILPVRYEIRDASVDELRAVIKAINDFELDYEESGFNDDSLELVVLTKKEYRADQFEQKFMQYIDRST